MSSNKKVIIIGGGLSGLSAADYIAQRSPNTQVTVLEAKERVGGRSFSGKIENAYFDYGGMWVGPHQKHIIELAKRAKVDLFPQIQKGKKIMELFQSHSTYKTDIPTNVNIFALIQMQYYIFRLNKWAKQIPREDPASAPLAHYWDSMTVESWVQDHIFSAKVRKLFECAIRGVFGVEPCEMSMLHFLWYTHQSESVENLLEVKNGNQEKKLVKGSQSLSLFLVEEMQKQNNKNQVLVNHPVQKIDQKNKQVIVHTKNNQSFEADYIILAMPPSSLQWMEFQPKLSIQREFINSRNYKGSIIKTLILYKNSFWKKKGFCAEGVSDCIDSPVFNLFEDTRTKENGEEQPALVVFTNGAVARHWRDKKEFKDTILKKLSKWFDTDEALKPIHFHIQDWSECEYIRGGPVCVFPPGVLSQLKSTLYQSEGLIHYAGTEYATDGQGFLDGAIQSGNRAGQEILDRIQNKKDQVNLKQEKYVDFHQYYKYREETVPLLIRQIIFILGIFAILYIIFIQLF